MRNIAFVFCSAVLVFSSAAHAVCDWEWSGINSHWNCPDGETVGGNYHDLFQALRKQLTGKCAKAIGAFYAKDFACLSAISTGVEASTLVQVGEAAGEASACKSLGGAFQQVSDDCKEDVKFKNNGGPDRSRTVKACNETGVPLRVAVGYRLSKNSGWAAHGWQRVPKGQCRELVSSNWNPYVRAESLDGVYNWVPGNQARQFCIGSGFKTTFWMETSECNDPLGSHHLANFGELTGGTNGVIRFGMGPARILYYVQENGIDYPNNDIRHFSADSVGECQDVCNLDKKCNLTAYDKVQKICYLKTRAAGRRNLAKITTSHAFDRNIEIDYPNNDIRNFMSTGWGQCTTACLNDPACKGAVLAPSNNRCWLKKSLPSNNRIIKKDRDTYIRLD